jgi:hypothetical protein
LSLNNLGSTTLNQANQVPVLTGTGLAGTLQFTDAQNLSVQGLNGPGQTVTLTGNGGLQLNQSTSPMTLGRLNLNNWGPTGLTLANVINNFSVSGASGPIQFNDNQSLDVLGIGAAGQTVTLTADGADNLTETSGTVTAGQLNLNNWVSTTMNQANQVGILTASTPGTGGFQFTIGTGTTVVQGILDIGQIVTLSGTGAGSVLNESIAPIVGNELDLNDLGPTTLNQANPIGFLKIANAAGTTQFTDAENLTLEGIGAAGQTVVLNGGGNDLGQSGVNITAGELDLDNWSGMFLSSLANQVSVLKVIGGSGQLSYDAGAGNLDLQGVSDPGETVLLTGVGAGSTLTESAGVINASILNLTGFGPTTLNQANQVGAFTATGVAGALQFGNGTSFNVENVAAAGQAIALTASGDNNELTVLPGFNVSAGNVTLTGDRINIAGNVTASGSATIRESTAGRQITIGTDDVNAPTASGGTLGLTVSELDSISTGTLQIGDASSGNVAITAVLAPVTFNTLEMQSGASINENPGASLTIGSLAAQAPIINLGTGNSVGVLAAITPGSLTFVNAGSLTIGNADGITGIQANGGAGITAQSGTLTVNSPINGPGGITLTANAMAINTTINSGVANTIFQPFTAGVSANFGSPIAGDFNLTQAELNEVTANVLQIGNNLSGAPVNAQFVVAPLTVHQLLILGGNSSITLLSQQLAALSSVETPTPSLQVADFSSASLSLDEASKILPAGAIGTIWLQLPLPHETARTYKVEDISKWTSGPMAAVGGTAGPQIPR